MLSVRHWGFNEISESKKKGSQTGVPLDQRFWYISIRSKRELRDWGEQGHHEGQGCKQELHRVRIPICYRHGVRGHKKAEGLREHTLVGRWGDPRKKCGEKERVGKRRMAWWQNIQSEHPHVEREMSQILENRHPFAYWWGPKGMRGTSWHISVAFKVIVDKASGSAVIFYLVEERWVFRTGRWESSWRYGLGEAFRKREDSNRGRGVNCLSREIAPEAKETKRTIIEWARKDEWLKQVEENVGMFLCTV